MSLDYFIIDVRGDTVCDIAKRSFEDNVDFFRFIERLQTAYAGRGLYKVYNKVPIFDGETIVPERIYELHSPRGYYIFTKSVPRMIKPGVELTWRAHSFHTAGGVETVRGDVTLIF